MFTFQGKQSLLLPCFLSASYADHAHNLSLAEWYLLPLNLINVPITAACLWCGGGQKFAARFQVFPSFLTQPCSSVSLEMQVSGNRQLRVSTFKCSHYQVFSPRKK